MKIPITHTFLLGLLLIGTAGCKSKIPVGVMSPEEMKPVLFDVLVAEQINQTDTAALTRAHLRDSTTYDIRRVLAMHQVPESTYFKSLRFYEANPDLLKVLLDSTKSYGSVLQDSLQKKKNMEPVKIKDTLKPPDSLLIPLGNKPHGPVRTFKKTNVKAPKAVTSDNAKN